MRQNPLRQRGRIIPALTAALMAAGVLTNVQAQIQSAGTLFVNVDATALPEGPLPAIPNTGTLGGTFSANGGAAAIPVIATEGGTKGIRMDGGDYLQLVDASTLPIAVPEGLIGFDPTRSIEVWAFNPALAGEETLVSWGKRGGPDGSNMSFNYGSDYRWGAVGSWGDHPDLGWNNAGGGPPAGRWHHLVYTFDGSSIRVYSDGALANATYVGEGRINTHFDGTLLIGAQNEPDAPDNPEGLRVTGGLRFTGAIARVRVHDEVLTPAQIVNNYNFEKSAFVDPAPPAPPVPVTPTRLSKLPVHRYSFSAPAGDATDQAITDSIGSDHGIVLGEGATFTGSRLVLPGGPSATAAYGDLPNGLVSSHSTNNSGTGQITIETWLKLTGGRTWSRIWDIGSSGLDGSDGEELPGPGDPGSYQGRDYLAYTAQVGGDVNLRRLELRNEGPPGGGITTSDNAINTFNTDTHVVVTWDEATGQIIGYENGWEVNRMTVDDPMSDLNDVNVWLGRSNWPGDANTQGEYDEFRIYDYVLSAGEVAGNTAAGPDNFHNQEIPAAFTMHPQSVTVPETATLVLRGAAVGSAPLSLQWFRDGTAIPGATSNAFTIPSITAAHNGAVYTLQASNTVGGSAVVVTSSPATITATAPSITLKHRYSFNEEAGLQANDSVSAAHANLYGGAALGGGEVALDGIDGFVDLPNGIVTGLGQDGTIEMWITSENFLNWARVFDLGASGGGEDISDGGTDYLFFTSTKGNEGYPQFEANFPGGDNVAVLIPQSNGLPGREKTHVVVSWSNSGNTSRMFFNGVLVAQGVAPRPLSAMNNMDVNNWLGRSQWPDPFWQGKYDEFRLYTGAMTPSQAAASFAAGPNSLPVAAPRITAQISGANLVLSYANAAGFALEATTSLSTPNWAPVAGATATGATVPLDGQRRFFRLRRP